MTRTMRASLAVVTATMIGATVGTFGFAGAASAHVTVSPNELTQGGYGRVAFRVPTESDTASTTKVEVHLPADHPIASVSYMTVPGWTVDVQRRKLDKPVKVHDSELTEAVSVITWTAVGDAAVKPGQFQEFPVSMGPLPETDKLVFKSLQTYSDGKVVRWIEEPAADGGEVENPAPVLRLTPKTAKSTATAGAAAGGDRGADGGQADAAGRAGSDRTAIGLGLVGLVAGLAGLVLGALALRRTGRA